MKAPSVCKQPQEINVETYNLDKFGRILKNIVIVQFDFDANSFSPEMARFAQSVSGGLKWKGINQDALLKQFPFLKRVCFGWKAFDHLNKSLQTRTLIEKEQVAWDSTAMAKTANFLSRIGKYAFFIQRFHRKHFGVGMFVQIDMVSQFIIFLSTCAKKGNTVRHHTLEIRRLLDFFAIHFVEEPEIIRKCTNVIRFLQRYFFLTFQGG